MNGKYLLWVTDLTFISEYNHSNSVADGECLMIVQKNGIGYRKDI